MVSAAQEGLWLSAGPSFPGPMQPSSQVPWETAIQPVTVVMHAVTITTYLAPSYCHLPIYAKSLPQQQSYGLWAEHVKPRTQLDTTQSK